MTEKTETIIFDFIWGNTYGLIGDGYHLMIKDSADKLYLTYSVDLKYGEIRFDDAKVTELIKDLKELHVDSWNGKTYSRSEYEEEKGDTWRLSVNQIGMILEAKGANDYPPEWKEFLNYFHVKYSVPVSRREDPTIPRPKSSQSEHKGRSDGKNRSEHKGKPDNKGKKDRPKEDKKPRKDVQSPDKQGAAKQAGDKPKSDRPRRPRYRRRGNKGENGEGGKMNE